MNKHFEDAKYYLKRAGETAKKGVEEELDPLRDRFKRMAGKEDEDPEPSRVDKLREDLKDLEKKAEGEAKEAIQNARSKLEAYRRA